MIKIGIVNDVSMARRVLARLVEEDPQLQVLWAACDGQEAVELCQAQTPDLILMDLVMPRMNGADATREIMRATPCPILLVTSTIAGHSTLVYQGLANGALDVTTTPVLGDRRGSDDGILLLDKIHRLMRQSAQTLAVGTSGPVMPASRRGPASQRHPGQPVVAMGASSGGPSVLAEILRALQPPIHATVLLAQHIDPEFADGLVEWLNSQTQLAVVMAREGDVPEPGKVFVADSRADMTLSPDGCIRYTPQARNGFVSPSIDVLFDSVARSAAVGSTGIILTGMGTDGAQGLAAMRAAGMQAIVQRLSSAVVVSMPRAAQALVAQHAELAPAEMAVWLQQQYGR